jgi:hypothetical protein
MMRLQKSNAAAADDSANCAGCGSRPTHSSESADSILAASLEKNVDRSIIVFSKSNP